MAKWVGEPRAGCPWAGSLANSYAKMCELSELSELSTLLLGSGGVEVCALSALCPPFEVEGDAKTAFSSVEA